MLGLVLIFEGFTPFLAPKLWRNMLLKISQRDDTSLRIIGLVSMLAGLGIVYLLR
jgi:uncharacterized protein YjeT (DUF2065 family)